MRRGTFNADFRHYRLEFTSHHGVVRRPSFYWQLYNGHHYPLDVSYGCRDRLFLPWREVVHRSLLFALSRTAQTWELRGKFFIVGYESPWDHCPCQEPRRKERSPPPTSGARAPKNPGVFSKLFAEVAKVGSREVGRAWVFALALGTVVVWAISGPFFGFSDTWQLVINTGTTIVTFLMVFLIQNSQNRDSAAIQVKLDELIRVSKANNAFMGLEHLTDEELEDIEGKNEGRAKAVLEARKASEDAKRNTKSLKS
jgi:low affinity Fe/Cu permease